jgi:hypothetical protein
MARHVKRLGKRRNVCRILVSKPEGKRPKRREVDNINMNLGEIGWGGMKWIDLAQDKNQWRTILK